MNITSYWLNCYGKLLSALIIFTYPICAIDSVENFSMLRFESAPNQRTFYLLVTNAGVNYNELPLDVRKKIEQCQSLYVENKVSNPDDEHQKVHLEYNYSRNPSDSDWFANLSAYSRDILSNLFEERVIELIQRWRVQFAYAFLVVSQCPEDPNNEIVTHLGHMFSKHNKPIQGIFSIQDTIETAASHYYSDQEIQKAIIYFGENHTDSISLNGGESVNLSHMEKKFEDVKNSVNPVIKFSNRLYLNLTTLFVERLLEASTTWTGPSIIAIGDQLRLVTKQGIIALFQEKGWCVKRLTAKGQFVAVKNYCDKEDEY